MFVAGIFVLGIVVAIATNHADKVDNTPETSSAPQHVSDDSSQALTQATAALETQQTKQAAPPPEPPIQITAGALYADYDANEVAADDKYKGKSLAVTGTIKSIEKDFSDNPYILLFTGENQYQNVRVRFSKGQAPQLAKLTKGASVTITCLGDGRLVGDPILDCRQ